MPAYSMHLASLFLLLLATASFAVAQSSFCNATCQAAYDVAFARESANWVSQDVTADPFYTVPSNITAEPGSLIRWQNIPSAQLASNFTVPAGLSLSRFLYVSEDINGIRIAASAYALLPFTQTKTAADGSNSTDLLNTVVFTHGTAGNNPNCAPSNHRTLYYEWEGPLMVASSGFAVIGPDYAGLGASRPNGLRYMAGYLHAGDVAYALIAARSSPIGPLLSHQWVVAGHSEGGLVAWRVNERLAITNQSTLREKTGEFLGAVAVAPATQAWKQPPPAEDGSQPYKKRDDDIDLAGNPYPMLMFQAYSEAFPDDIRPENYLTDLALARLQMNKGCFDTTAALFKNLTMEQMFKNTSWEKSPRLIEWSTKWNGAGVRELAAPMLVIAGLDDAVTLHNLDGAVNKTCTKFPKSTIRSLKLPSMGHDQCFQASQGNYLQ